MNTQITVFSDPTRPILGVYDARAYGRSSHLRGAHSLCYLFHRMLPHLLAFILAFFFAIRLQKCPPCCVCCSMFSQCRSRKIWDRSIPSVQHLLTKLESCRLLWTEHIPINGLRLQFTTTSNRLATAHSRFAKSPLRSNTAFLS